MVILMLLLIAVVSVLIFLSYRIPKRMGYPKAGKYISIILSLLIGFITTYVIFEDDLFTKADAQTLLSEQDIQLSDEFDIEEHISMYAPGDYYHTFTLKITSKDKKRIINEIKSSSNFSKEEQVEDYSGNRNDYYRGPKRVKNYETNDQYIRELFEPQGVGYAPTWRKIEIEKKSDKLIFEDIDE